MKKKVFFCSLSIICINLALSSMDHITDIKKSNNQGPTHDTVIPDLHLSQLPNATQEKTIIETFKDFEILRNSKTTVSTTLQTSRNTINKTLPKIFSNQTDSQRLFTEDNFSEDLKRELISQCELTKYDADIFTQSYGKTLYDFGKENDISLDNTVIYGVLLRKFEVTPQALIELVNHQNDISDKKANTWQINEYSDIKKNTAEKYTRMVLDAITSYCKDEHNKNKKKSALTNAHIEILGGKVKNQQKTIYLQYTFMACKVVIILAQLSWGLYGQIAPYVNKGNHT